jgi:acetoacetyl-CoA synthetase
MPAIPDSTDSSGVGDPVWVPDPKDAARSQLSEFAALIEDAHGTRFHDYDDLWAWTVEHLEEFWAAA